MHKFLIYTSIYFCLTCFGFLAHLQRQVYNFGSGSSLLVKVLGPARALTPYPRNLNHLRNCTPASEDGLKETPKHVRQK
jgi:hypothetical protein